MLAGKADNIVQLFYRYISRKLQKYRFANLLLFVCCCNQYGTEDFWSNASPVDCIIIGIFAESAVQICNFCSSQLFVGSGKIGVCCYSSLAERSAENHENSVFTSIDYQSITNNSQTGFL